MCELNVKNLFKNLFVRDFHSKVIPILYMILWAFSIYLCALDLHLERLGLPLKNVNLVQGAGIIYVTFLFECVINLTDFAYQYQHNQFTIKFICWLIKLIFNIALSLGLVLFVIASPSYTNIVGWFLFGLVCYLKYLYVSFSNNIEIYMLPTKFIDYTSTFNEMKL